MNKTILRKQRVRILATNELGTVIEKVLIKRPGEQHPQPYCNVALDNKPGVERWYFAKELGDPVERATVTISCGKQSVRLRIDHDHQKGVNEIDMTGAPKNLKEHHGLHMIIACALFIGLGAKPSDLKTYE